MWKAKVQRAVDRRNSLRSGRPRVVVCVGGLVIALFLNAACGRDTGADSTTATTSSSTRTHDAAAACERYGDDQGLTWAQASTAEQLSLGSLKQAIERAGFPALPADWADQQDDTLVSRCIFSRNVTPADAPTTMCPDGAGAALEQTLETVGVVIDEQGRSVPDPTVSSGTIPLDTPSSPCPPN